MKHPVEHVRISVKGKEILLKVKKRTGLERWNEICRVAFCRSLTNPAVPTITLTPSESAIDIEWKTFAGNYSAEYSAVLLLRAHADGVDTESKEALADYFKAHIERGISSLQNIKSLSELVHAAPH